MSERDMTIVEFCDVHAACIGGRKWALETCRTMQDVWNLVRPEWLVWVALRGWPCVLAYWTTVRFASLLAGP